MRVHGAKNKSDEFCTYNLQYLQTHPKGDKSTVQQRIYRIPECNRQTVKQTELLWLLRALHAVQTDARNINKTVSVSYRKQIARRCFLHTQNWSGLGRDRTCENFSVM